MKKLIIITSLVATCAVAQITTTPTQDAINLQQARIEALDAQYKAQTNQLALQHIMQRNTMLRQLEKTNSVVISSPIINRQPVSATPSN